MDSGNEAGLNLKGPIIPERKGGKLIKAPSDLNRTWEQAVTLDTRLNNQRQSTAVEPGYLGVVDPGQFGVDHLLLEVVPGREVRHLDSIKWGGGSRKLKIKGRAQKKFNAGRTKKAFFVPMEVLKKVIK